MIDTSQTIHTRFAKAISPLPQENFPSQRIQCQQAYQKPILVSDRPYRLESRSSHRERSGESMIDCSRISSTCAENTISRAALSMAEITQAKTSAGAAQKRTFPGALCQRILASPDQEQKPRLWQSARISRISVRQPSLQPPYDARSYAQIPILRRDIELYSSVSRPDPSTNDNQWRN